MISLILLRELDVRILNRGLGYGHEFPVHILSNRMQILAAIFFLIDLLIYCLQALVTSLEKRIDDADKKCAETIRVSEERLKKAVEAESKINNMNKEMQRFLISLRDLVLPVLLLRFS